MEPEDKEPVEPAFERPAEDDDRDLDKQVVLGED